MLRGVWLTAALATMLLALAASSASAWRELEIEGRSRERIRQTSSGAITFREMGVNFAVCNMTLNGTLNGARLTNAMPRSIGAITRVEIERSCEATVLALPWTYDFGIVLPASGMESGEAIPPANVTGAQIGFLEVGRRAFPGFSFRGPFGTCLYEGPLPLLFAINRGRWEPLEIEPLTTFGLVRGLCERRITLVGAFNPPEPAQRLNFT